MQISTTVNMHNKFDVQLIDGKTNEIKQQCTAYNVVLNTYYSDQSKNVYTPLTTIAIGTGTGTPAVTDTALFSALTTKSGSPSSLTHIIDDNIYKFYFTLTITFNESEANGDLTEIGLGSKLYTHAMFTDSEGSAISIHKTNNDRLTVTATVYITFTFPNDVIPLPVRTYTELAVNKGISDKYTTLVADYTPDFITKTYTSVSSSSHAPRGIYIDYAKHSNRPGLHLATSSSYQDPVYRYTSDRLLAASSNLSTTWQAFAIHTEYCIIPLPNHNIFEPIPLTLEKTADGSTTDFNFGIPELMVEGTEVYVDDVLMSPSTYTFYGKDFSCRQAWVSQHGTYLAHHEGDIQYATSSMGNNPGRILPIMCNGESTSVYNLTLYYDFKAPYIVNALKHEINGNCSLYYSNDNTNWTLVATRPTSVGTVYTFSPITARYWKTNIDSFYNANYDQNNQLVKCTGAFDNMQPQLKFNTPPAANSVIKIVTKSEYPIKNENWIIEPIVFDVTRSRA